MAVQRGNPSELVKEARGILEDLRQGSAPGIRGVSLLEMLEDKCLKPEALDTAIDPRQQKPAAKIMDEVRQLVKSAWIRDAAGIYERQQELQRPVPRMLARMMQAHLAEADKIKVEIDPKREAYARKMAEAIVPVLAEERNGGVSQNSGIRER